jgi:AmmeMemoRadiSam system protein B
MSDIRPAAVAGTWYPANADQLADEVDGYLDTADGTALVADLVAIIAPHAGLMYSGPVAAHAYRQLRDRAIDTLIIVGP